MLLLYWSTDHIVTTDCDPNKQRGVKVHMAPLKLTRSPAARSKSRPVVLYGELFSGAKILRSSEFQDQMTPLRKSR